MTEHAATLLLLVPLAAALVVVLYVLVVLPFRQADRQVAQALEELAQSAIDGHAQPDQVINSLADQLVLRCPELAAVRQAALQAAHHPLQPQRNPHPYASAAWTVWMSTFVRARIDIAAAHQGEPS